MDADDEQALGGGDLGELGPPARIPWTVTELVAFGAALASVGLMVGGRYDEDGARP